MVLPLNQTQVLDDGDEGHKEEFDFGIIIGVISLFIVIIAIVVIILYFSRLKKKVKTAASIIRNDSSGSTMGVLNSSYSINTDSSNALTLPTTSSGESLSDEISVRIDGKDICKDDNTLNAFLNNIELSAMECNHTDQNQDNLEAVDTTNFRPAKRSKSADFVDPILFHFLKRVEKTSLGGEQEINGTSKCDGKTIVCSKNERKVEKNNKRQNEKEPNLNYVRTISEIENSENSNGEKDKSYFNVHRQHSEYLKS